MAGSVLTRLAERRHSAARHTVNAVGHRHHHRRHTSDRVPMDTIATQHRSGRAANITRTGDVCSDTRIGAIVNDVSVTLAVAGEIVDALQARGDALTRIAEKSDALSVEATRLEMAVDRHTSCMTRLCTRVVTHSHFRLLIRACRHLCAVLVRTITCDYLCADVYRLFVTSDDGDSGNEATVETV